MNNPVLRWGVGAVLLAVLGWGLYASIEFYEETEESGWSRAALQNPYLAAQRFLERSGVEVTEVESLARLDRLGGVGTLFFSDGNQVQSPRQLRHVLDWLENGGNVIYSANRVEHEDDLLLAEFGVEVDWSESRDEADERTLAEMMREYNREIERGKSREEASRALNPEPPALTLVRFDEPTGTLEAAFDNDRVLLHSSFDDSDADAAYRPFSWSNSSSGIHMMQFEVGDGLLTLVSDPSIWTSAAIDQHDHAYLLWLLISTDGSFATLRSVVRETLWQILTAQAAPLLFAIALLVLLAVWRAGRRFGRVGSAERAENRALGQHFLSLSMYLWRRHAGDWLLDPLRQRIWQRAGMVLAEFAGAERARQLEMLAEHAGIDAAAIASAFDNDDFREAAFVHTVRLLKRIEQTL